MSANLAAELPRAERAAPYPFAAIVGQEEMKRCLLLAAVDPLLGGVLILGDRGTGKSTAVRALAALLPPMQVVADCAYNCDPAAPACPRCTAEKRRRTASRMAPIPVVDLPLGTTEDRLLGALDLEAALARGEARFAPGLLARAHRGFLYVDEVNLLDDHLVDLLLDVAASGENVVEREQLSVRHPARFVLVGSGNPEEGDLRPQLLDRFGLAVAVGTPATIPERVAVLRHREAFEDDPAAFAGAWAAEQMRLRARIGEARARLRAVQTPDHVLEDAAALCVALGTDGLRGELALLRAARALAAFQDDATVEQAHLRAMATAALGHRLRRAPLDEAGAPARIERALAELPAR